jgi:hypothetical protein
MVEPSREIFPESGCGRTTVDLSKSRRACPPGTGLNTTKRGHTEDNPRAFTHPAAHPAAPCQNGRCLPALRSGRVCNGRSPPPPSRAWRPRAPDEGRCRADPHCTHDGHRRHCRNDHRYFHAVHQPPARFGAAGRAALDPDNQHNRAVAHRTICVRDSERSCTGNVDDAPCVHHHPDDHDDHTDNHGHTSHHTDDHTGAGDRRHQRRYGRLGVYSSPRVRGSVQQPGGTIGGLRDPDQHLAFVRIFGLAL